MPPRADSVAALVEARMEELRPAERKVARALLADYPRNGLGTATMLAAEAGVSAPTVVRCATALGYDGFAALQAALLDEVSERRSGPLARVGRSAAQGGLAESAEVLLSAARATVAGLNPIEWDSAVDLLADPRRRITATGGRSTMPVAELLTATLEMVRDDVHLLTDPARRQTSHLLGFRKRDVLVAFDIARYQSSTIALTRLARRRGASIIVITDRHLSPAARDANVVLAASVSSPTPFAGITPLTLVVELLLGDVQRRLGESATDRLQAWEEFRRTEVLDHAGKE